MRTLARRVVEVLIMLFGVSLAGFAVVAIAPGDVVLSLLRIDTVAVTQAQIDAARADLGLDDPLHERYLAYLGALLRGDLGDSLMTGRPVVSEIARALPATAILAAVTLGVTAIAVVVLGALAARYRDTAIDRAVMALCYLGASIPTFWLGLVLIDALAVRVRLLPSSGWHGGLGLILPVAALTLAIAPPFVKIFRGAFLDLDAENFIRAARARGIPERLVVRCHLVRGALVPVVTMLGVSLGHLLSGSVVVEAVFGLPGLGRLAVEAATRRDYTVVQGLIVVTGLLVIVATVLVDLCNRLIDPSIGMRNERA